MTLEEALAKYPGGTPYRPGDGPALNAEIIALMRAGAKTATCALDAEFTEDEPMPVPGRVDIALAWDRAPALATRTLSVERIRFDRMDEARVPAQGEFADLAAWRQGYEAYLTRLGLFRPDLELVYERFEVVEDFAPAGT